MPPCLAMMNSWKCSAIFSQALYNTDKPKLCALNYSKENPSNNNYKDQPNMPLNLNPTLYNTNKTPFMTTVKMPDNGPTKYVLPSDGS